MGKIKDPAATNHGKENGLIPAYDGHNVDTGRIVADATWHHWFDIDLTGIAAPPSPYADFDATPAGQAALKKIDAYSTGRSSKRRSRTGSGRCGARSCS